MDAAAATGIVLTDALAMHPTASVSGLYFAAPEAQYFQVSRGAGRSFFFLSSFFFSAGRASGQGSGGRLRDAQGSPGS